jgi:general secretion pathway protein I
MRRANSARGITLYEVVIALAIFAGAIAALSQALSTATRAALQSRMQSQAVLLCQTKLAEVVAGAVPSTSSGDTPFTESGLEGWTWSVSVTPAAHSGINDVSVTVNSHMVQDFDTTFTMSRLVRDQQTFVTSAISAAKEKALQSGLTQQQSQASQ